jgi:hypothetical protein
MLWYPAYRNHHIWAERDLGRAAPAGLWIGCGYPVDALWTVLPTLSTLPGIGRSRRPAGAWLSS